MPGTSTVVREPGGRGQTESARPNAEGPHVAKPISATPSSTDLGFTPRMPLSGHVEIAQLGHLAAHDE
jgi:hypothetical protein